MHHPPRFTKHVCKGFGRVPVAMHGNHEPSDTDSDLPPDAASSATDDTITSDAGSCSSQCAPTSVTAAATAAPPPEDPYTPAQRAAARCIQHSWRRYVTQVAGGTCGAHLRRYLLRALRAQRARRQSALVVVGATAPAHVRPTETRSPTPATAHIEEATPDATITTTRSTALPLSNVRNGYDSSCWCTAHHNQVVIANDVGLLAVLAPSVHPCCAPQAPPSTITKTLKTVILRPCWRRWQLVQRRGRCAGQAWWRCVRAMTCGDPGPPLGLLGTVCRGCSA